MAVNSKTLQALVDAVAAIAAVPNPTPEDKGVADALKGFHAALANVQPVQQVKQKVPDDPYNLSKDEEKGVVQRKPFPDFMKEREKGEQQPPQPLEPPAAGVAPHQPKKPGTEGNPPGAGI